MPEEFKEIIEKLLEVNPNNRPSLEDLLNNEWLNNY